MERNEDMIYTTLLRLLELVLVFAIALLKPVRRDKLRISNYFRSNLLPSNHPEVRCDSGKEEHYVQEVWGTYFPPIDSTEYDVLGLRLNFVDDAWPRHDTAFFSLWPGT